MPLLSRAFSLASISLRLDDQLEPPFDAHGEGSPKEQISDTERDQQYDLLPYPSRVHPINLKHSLNGPEVAVRNGHPASQAEVAVANQRAGQE